jgi:hypothetical protein
MTPSARLAALQGTVAVPSGKPAEGDGPVPKLTSTISGPSEVKVGDEFTVTLQLQSDQPVAHVRAQLRFDGSAFQLISGDTGGMVPDSAGAKVVARPGGAQLDVAAPPGEPMPGSGDLMVLKFKVAQPRPQASFAAQVTIIGASGATLANITPTALAVVAAQ